MDHNLNTLLNEPLFSESAVGSTLREKPLGFVDIGARGGVHPLVEPLAGVTAVLGFEPDADECARLNADIDIKRNWSVFKVEPLALAADDRIAELHLLSAPTNHSLLRPNLKFTDRYKMVKWREIGVSALNTTSLDKVLFGTRSKEDYWGEFLKLDTQGTEYEILQGAVQTLKERTVAIFCEVEFFQVMNGQKLFSDVEILLRELGFVFYGFTTVGNRSCKLLDKRVEAGRERMFYADAVFFKDPLSGGLPNGQLSERAVHVLFTCSVLLGYYDFALELALATWAKGDEAKRIEALVRNCASLSAKQTHDDVMALAQSVNADPDLANVKVGRFVDRRRFLCDYNDLS